MRLPLRLVLLGAGAYEIESGIRAVSQGAIDKIQSGARAQSTKQWAVTTGLTAFALSPPISDHAAAIMASDSLAKRWRNGLRIAESQGLNGPRAIRKATALLEPSVNRVATSEAMRAWNDETRRQDVAAHDYGYTVEETWCAELDACSACWEMSGMVAVLPERLPEDPPMHPHCRCFISTSVSDDRKSVAA